MKKSFLTVVAVLLSLLISQHAAAAEESCLNCNEYEKIMVELSYVNQVLDVLQSYQKRHDELEPQTVEIFKKYMLSSGQSRDSLDQFLQTRAATKVLEDNAFEGKVLENVALLPKTPPKPKPAPRSKGIDGLLVAYAQELNEAVGRDASVSLSSHGKVRSFGIGSTFVHNRTSYAVQSISRATGANGLQTLNVAIKAKKGKPIVLPWQD